MMFDKLSPEDHQKALFQHLYNGVDQPLHRPVFVGPPTPFYRHYSQSENAALFDIVKNFPFHLFPPDHFKKIKQPMRKRA